MRGTLLAGGVAGILLAGTLPGAAHARADSEQRGPAPKVQAKASLLVLNGKTVWSVNAAKRRPIASLTKVMTAVVVLRSGGSLDRVVKIKKKYTTFGDKYGATEAGLKPGDKVKVRDLLYGTLLESGADSAAALADTYGPGYAGFIAKMNATARKLGLRDTHYANFDGLPYPTQYTTYSTAVEQVKLAAHAYRYKTFQKIVATRKIKVRTTGKRTYTWVNTNTLLGKYKGLLGIKTGYTDKAGYCFVFAARRGKKVQIGVVLGSPTINRRFVDAAHLLDWGFGLPARRYAFTGPATAD
ncbi:D-alanyl-D-alanine carboxypeptidase family protein [Actinocorallia longicatena]|uniref:Serine hydrolase n=1 Tax=Actinocorallia longicatena TaxID=111803 RepID=A0ABP6QC49_9ACTN